MTASTPESSAQLLNLVADGIKIGQQLQPRPVIQQTNAAPKNPEFHQENAVVGIELNNYSKRTPSEDGTYVVVVNHTERIEKIVQPPTEEELAHQRSKEKLAMKLWAGVGTAFAVLGTAIVIVEAKRPRPVQQQS